MVDLTILAKRCHPGIDLDADQVFKEYLDRRGLEYPGYRTFVFPEIKLKTDLKRASLLVTLF